MSLFAELKRRKVFRVAVVYAATAFVVLQAADIMLPRLVVPEWAMTLVVVFAVLGFPIALVLGWALEVTPDGIRRTESAASGQGNTTAAPALLGKRTILAAAALVILGIGLGAGWFLKPSAPPGVRDGIESAVTLPSAGILDKSIAVLPFADFSPGGDQQWFADGLAEEILNALARTADLKVASRTASFGFRDSDQSLQAIGEILKVAHVLEGSVRRAGEQLRVTAQLIRASDGFHLWSENFDGSVKDAIAIQEQIALKIAQALKTAMNPEALAAMVSAGTRSVEAYEAYLRANALFEEMGRTNDFTMSSDWLSELQRAVAIDPGFSRAHAALAFFWLEQLSPQRLRFGLTDLPPDELRRRLDQALDAAIASAGSEEERLDYQADQARVRVQLAEQIALRRRVTELSPEDAGAWGSLGFALAEAGRYPEASEAMLKAADLVRGTAGELAFWATMLILANDPEAAVPLIERALVQPDFGLFALYQAHRALLHAGRVEQAAELARAHALRAGGTQSDQVVQIRQACAEGRLAEAEAIFAAIEFAAIEVHDGNHWLLLKTLGREEEARELLRPLDTPDRLFSLSSFLAYPVFDAADYPLLADTLARQGIQRPRLRLPFACQQPEEPAP